ncbi:zinc finger MYM-type 1-like [Paramuricea clavata]|uniref:Zinc finger MYM-type 1-like n=1 Tax=Paramuricea clavata TaxID=317549 RepID=A0A6S7FXY2_PARCT|nr:zinc finger MYM-type 1-like [Paramuricea clavata]
MRSLMSDGKKHEKTRSHLAAFIMWKTYGANVRVDSLLSQARRDEIQRHNEEELAFRGHDESEDSLNKDNYRELLESFAKFDSVFERRLHGRLAESERGGGGRFTGVSPEIQSDLINCLDSVIDDEILKQINDCTFMSVQVDEASDVSTKEQVSMIVRLDKDNEIVERQLGLVDARMNRNAAAISQVVKDKLGQYSNIKEKLIMQTHDGASVMSGHINGVQTLYFGSAFSTFTSNAPRRKAFLTSHNLEFPNPGDTRWYYRARVINVLYKNYEKLLEVFDEVTDQPDGWDDESLDKILEQSSILYSVLQNTGTDFSYGISRIERFKNFVSALRTDEDFDKFYQEAVDKDGQPVSRADKKHNYKQLYFEIIDSIAGMLSERFQDMKRFEFLDLVNPKSQRTFIYNDKDFHKEASNEVLKYIFQFNLQSSLPEAVKLLKILEVLKYIFQFNLQSSLPEAVKLLKMNGVLALSSASVERSFSCLKRVKGYLRNRMGQARLSSLCRISIHKDIIKLKEDTNVLHDEVVKKFVEKPRRLAFLYK